MTKPVFAITGNPVTHSKSPLLFRAAYHGKYRYELLPASSAEEAVRLFRTKGIRGMNVTMPFKSGLIPLVDMLHEEVSAIGAANTLVWEEGKIVAYNTDTAGITGALAARGYAVKNQSCLVIGAGGAGCAAAYALHQEGGRVDITNRTFEKAARFAGQAGMEAIPLEEVSARILHYRIIVNTIPYTAAFLTSLPLSAEQLVMDASYLSRPLQEQAAQAGAHYIKGEEWLLYQAVPAFTLFTGEPPDVEAMRAALYS